MKQIETNCKTIFRFDNVLSNRTCDKIVNFLRKSIREKNDLNINEMPWHDDDSYDWRTIKSDYLFAKIESYIELVSNIASLCYGEQVYPHFTDLVVWRAGRSMDRHWDDGMYEGEEYLHQRVYTSITYLNDDYTGGETYIQSENGDYISEPKKGSVVLLRSDKQNSHGVNKITSGVRYTLPIWFTRNYNNRQTYEERFE